MTSSAVVSCLAVRRTPLPLIRRPQSPYESVVPLVDPPVGIGMVPVCRLINVTLRGASWCLERTNDSPPFFGVDACVRRAEQRKEWVDREKSMQCYVIIALARPFSPRLTCRHPCRLTGLTLTLATMSDRKRALEEGGPFLASKKARRSVSILFTATSSC
jgi:hypothetical protein